MIDETKQTPARLQDSRSSMMEQAFAVFTETGIIAQLISTLLESRLPKGMVAAQFGVLNHLTSRPDGQTPLQLARAFQVPKGSVGQID